MEDFIAQQRQKLQYPILLNSHAQMDFIVPMVVLPHRHAIQVSLPITANQLNALFVQLASFAYPLIKTAIKLWGILSVLKDIIALKELERI